jgi:signal transduction histidine kinase
VEVSVLDQGVGIPVEDRKQIFERFVRGRGTKQVRGSGIGLALVKHIAIAHGGDAWVEPGEPTGSRFLFTVQIGKKAFGDNVASRHTESVA